MKKIISFMIVLIFLFALVSCEDLKIHQDPIGETESTEDAAENMNSESDLIDSGGCEAPYYFSYDIEDFLKKYEEDEAFRANILKYENGKSEFEAADTLLLPILQTEELMIGSVAVYHSVIWFTVISKADAGKEAFVDRILIMVPKYLQSFDSAMERAETANLRGEDWYSSRLEGIVVFDEGQRCVFDIGLSTVGTVETKEALEKIIKMERFTVNENGLCKETGKIMEERAALVQKDMTYAEVREIMGCSGKDVGSGMILYQWILSEEQSLTVCFKNPVMDEMTEFAYPDDCIVADITIEDRVG